MQSDVRHLHLRYNLRRLPVRLTVQFNKRIEFSTILTNLGQDRD